MSTSLSSSRFAFQVASDFHIYKSEGFSLPPVEADISLVAGDVSNSIALTARWLREASAHREVIFVLGNHEYMSGYFPSRLEELRVALGGANVTVLENDVVFRGDTRILGASLWTDFAALGDSAHWLTRVPPEGRGLFDFREIGLADESFPTTAPGRFTPRTAASLHAATLAWLRTELEKPHDGPTIVVTHFPPSLESIPERFRSSVTLPAFASDLHTFVEETSPDVWIHGHIHSPSQYLIKNTRVICNPRGYERERPTGFDPGLVIRL